MHYPSDTHTSDHYRFFHEVDTGGADCGQVILNCVFAAGSDIQDVEFWTSNVSDFGTDGTDLSAVASDGLAEVTIASDPSNLFARGLYRVAISDLTVASNQIEAITESGLYVITVRNLARYFKMMYQPTGSGSRVGAVFVGLDLPEVPYGGARTAY